MVTVRLLGPVDVLDDDGNRYAPNTPLRRTLITALALDAGHVVEADRLLEQVWDGDPPTSGRRTLRFHLSRLRREVAIDDVIITVPGGYRLDADVDSAEINEAVAYVAKTDPEHRVELARTLLGRWRGEPMVDAKPCDLVDHERRRLAELQLALTEQLYSALVDTGEATTLIRQRFPFAYLPKCSRFS
jgi:DNA-binding SARP family transcriptional activator